MLDNQLIALVISTILAQEEIAAIPGTPIQQAFQPTQQGVPSQNSGFLHKLYDHRLGSPYRGDVYDISAGKMIHTEIQDMESTFQISTLATQDPTSTTQYTASDICNLIAAILQTDTTIANFAAVSVGILRITDVRNPYFVDDRGRNAASPSFDFTLQHKQILTTTVPVITATDFQIIPV